MLKQSVPNWTSHIGYTCVKAVRKLSSDSLKTDFWLLNQKMEKLTHLVFWVASSESQHVKDYLTYRLPDEVVK